MSKFDFLKNRTFKFLVLIALLALFWSLGKVKAFDPEYFQDYLDQFPVLISGFIFIVLYVVLTFLIWFGPKDVLRVASAILFGAVVSTILVWIGECFNAAIFFLFSRKLGREFVEQKFRIKPKQIEKVKGSSDFIGLFALRINPLISFRFLDLGVGLTRVSLLKYMIVVIIASPFRVFWLQWILADAGMELLKDPGGLMDYFIRNPAMLYYSAIYFLIVFVLSVISIIMKTVKKN